MNATSGSGGRKRRPKSEFTTKSGKTIKVHHSLSDRLKASKLARSTDKAAYLSTLPKGRIMRVAYRLHPQRMAAFWFSREGGIMALKVMGISIIVGFFLIIGMFAYFRKDLPKLKNVSSASFGGSITYYDRTGKTVLWQDYDAVKRVPVEDDQISEFMKQATVAIEDKDFYKHGAFDVRGIARAAVNDVIGSGPLQGGSSITQQLVKLNQNWTNNRTVTRKVKELILAVELEREYTKKEILTGYLNIAPYGGVNYGVETASRDYFGKSAKDLTLAEATMLAAIPQAPRDYSPYSSPVYNKQATVNYFAADALIGRQQFIMDKMVEQGYITRAQAQEAKKVDILATVKPQSPKFQNMKAPFFVLSAKQELQQRFGSTIVARGGWSVITTLDVSLQEKAEDLIKANLPSVTRVGGDNQATVAEDVETGHIVALVGGVDYFADNDWGQNNFASGIKLPPGSSFKPYDYVTMINNNNNVGAGSVLYDSKTALPGYEGTCNIVPTFTSPDCPAGTVPYLYDYDRKFPGPMTLRYALGSSRNVPAAKAMISALPNDTSKGRVNSINKVISTASAMMANSFDQSKKRNSYNCYQDEALTVIKQCYLASSIGDGAYLRLDDHVNGLATMSRLGQAIPRTYIIKVSDSNQKSMYQWKQPTAKQVVRPDAAFIVNDIASDWKASFMSGSCTDAGCNSPNRGGRFHRFNGWQFAIKTGTTNDNYDGLMASWSSKYSMVTWVGHHTRNVALNTGSMEGLTSPINRGWMEFAHKDIKAVNWKQPTTVKSAPAFVVRNAVYPTSIVPSPANDLYPGWYVGGNKTTRNTSQTNDKVSGKVATSCTPDLAKDTVTNGNVQFWNVDIFSGGKATISDGKTTSATGAVQTDDVHNCNDAKPSVTLTVPAECTGSCTITATVTQGTHALNDPQYPQFPGTITFTLNGQTINSQNLSDSPSTVSFTYNPTSSGSGSITATATDSVLYSGSDSANFSYGAVVNQKLTITNPIGPQSSNNLTATWTATVNKGPYSVFVRKGSSGNFNKVCETSSLSCNFSLPLPATGSYSIYVKDSNDTASETVGFTR